MKALLSLVIACKR